MFRLLGFDVRVRPGFLIFMVLIVGLHGNEFGLWLAGSLTAFTLVHEFGHAFAARHNGAKAEIALDFLAGYTSFVPSRPLSKPQRALISFSGPGIHILSSVAVLAAMGVNPIDGDSYNRSDAAAAIWWAGPVIGVLNLIPVLPLDGGHIAQTGLEVVFGTRARRAMIIASLVITGTAALACFVDERTRGYTIFIAFLMFAQFQMLNATSVSGPRRSIAAAADAERSAWLTGRSGMMLPGQELSPWYRAHRALNAGRPDEARSVLISDIDVGHAASLVATRRGHARTAQATRSTAPPPAPGRQPAQRVRARRCAAAHGRQDHRRAVRRGVVLAEPLTGQRDRGCSSGGRDGRQGHGDQLVARRGGGLVGPGRERRRRDRSRAGAGGAARRSRAAQTARRPHECVTGSPTSEFRFT